MKQKSVFDYKDEPSIWTKDLELKRTALGKRNGLKRREQLARTEVWGDHVYMSKKNKNK